jgi:hypothetical protein
VDIESIIFCSTPSSPPSSVESPAVDQVAGKRRKFGPRGAPRNEPTAPSRVSGNNVDSVLCQ